MSHEPDGSMAAAYAVSADPLRRPGAHGGLVVWLTGLSGAGKTTLARNAAGHLRERGVLSYVLDGDVIRTGINRDLGFSEVDRRENVRRAGEIAALFADAGVVVLAAFISPSAADRDRARQAAAGRFHEVHVRASLAACEARDPKGLYRRARAGEITEFTGISAPYDAPCAPDLVVDTEQLSIDAAVARLVTFIARQLRF